MTLEAWEYVRLGELAEIRKGKKVPTHDIRTPESISYIGAKTFKSPPDSFTTSTEAVLCDPADVLLLWDGERSGLAGTGLSGAVSSTVARIRPHDLVDPRFLFHVLVSKYSWIQRHRTGQAVPHVPKNLKTMLEVPVPPLPEQRKIAAILSSLDEVIEKSEAVIEQLQVVKEAMTQELLTRGLPGRHTRFKQTKIGEIPERWELSTLGEVADFWNGKAHEPFITETGKYTVINSKFISTEAQTAKHTDEGLSVLQQGDVAIVMSDIPKGRALAKCYLVPENEKYTLNQRIGGLRATRVTGRYLYYALNRNQYFLGFDDGVGQTNLRKQTVLDCPVAIPPHSEQQQIVESVQSVDRMLIESQEEVAETANVKKALMSLLLTGEVRVSPDEEAA